MAKADKPLATLHTDESIAEDIRQALQSTELWSQFVALAPSHRKEYLQWIDEAKKPETRIRRIHKMREMLKEKRA